MLGASISRDEDFSRFDRAEVFHTVLDVRYGANWRDAEGVDIEVTLGVLERGISKTDTLKGTRVPTFSLICLKSVVSLKPGTR